MNLRHPPVEATMNPGLYKGESAPYHRCRGAIGRMLWIALAALAFSLSTVALAQGPPTPPQTETLLPYPPPPTLEPTPAPVPYLIGTPFPITKEATGTHPVVVYNRHTHEYLVIWSDIWPGESGVFGQRVHRDGSLAGGAFRISPILISLDRPGVASSGATGEYLVVWSKEPSIYAQRVGGDGSLKGETVAIATAPRTNQLPAVAWNSQADEYLVAWENAPTLVTREIHGQRVSGDGKLLGDHVVIDAGPWSITAALGWDDLALGYLAVWAARYSYDTALDIYARWLDPLAIPQGSRFPVADVAGDQEAPSLAKNLQQSEWLVVGTDNRHGSGVLDIYGHIIPSQSSLVDVSFPITTAPEWQMWPSVAYSPMADQYLVVWASVSRDDGDIVARRLSSDGALLGAELSVVAGPRYQRDPVIAYNDDDDEFLMVWLDSNWSAWVAEGTVYAQRMSLTLPPPAEIPEPGTLLLMGSGLAGLAGYALLRRRVTGRAKQ